MPRKHPSKDGLPLIISTNHLARILGRDNRTIRDWVKNGKLPPRIWLTDRTMGWWRDEIMGWVDKNPKAVRHG